VVKTRLLGLGVYFDIRLKLTRTRSCHRHVSELQFMYLNFALSQGHFDGGSILEELGNLPSLHISPGLLVQIPCGIVYEIDKASDSIPSARVSVEGTSPSRGALGGL
jgi:hypothetical protein